MPSRPVSRSIVVNRDLFILELWTRPLGAMKLRLWKTIRCAVGKVGYETPPGLYLINDKVLDPPWRLPDADWVPKADWGKLIPAGDPDNPLTGAWLSVDAGEAVGIHGTTDPSSIGSAASHGCIRVLESDALFLYKKVPLYTPVFII